jgi:hypothetical protein
MERIRVQSSGIAGLGPAWKDGMKAVDAVAGIALTPYFPNSNLIAQNAVSTDSLQLKRCESAPERLCPTSSTYFGKSKSRTN